MITGELKSKVDRIWDTMWSGGISNPLSVIEQLTYLLFIKRLDELHTLKERKASRLNQLIEEPVFQSNQDHLRWSRFKDLAPEEMFVTVRDQVFPFIKSLGKAGPSDAEGDSTYSHHMKDALFMMPTARVLANVVDQLDGMDMADRDTKGDLYEYMLGKIASAGQNGQFRTPRHIIKLMVDMTAPVPKDTICDPACGTAGFLIAASEYMRDQHEADIFKDADSRHRFNAQTFHGYDFDNTMLRIGSMNMLLHGVENPDISYKDSLAQADESDAAKILDHADALRAKRREAIAKLDTFLQSTFLDMFGDPVTDPKGWKVKKLGELGAGKGAIVDGPFGSAISVKKDYTDLGDVPVVRTKNVSPFQFVTKDLKYISEQKFQTVSRSEVLPGDIILTKVGTIGHVCFFPDTYPKGVLSTTGSCRIRADLTRISPIYLARYLHGYRPQMLEMAATGVQTFLNMKHIKGFRVLLPPLPLQQQFANIVTKVEARKQQMRDHLTQLDPLFASLQNRAFNGEL